MTEMTNHWEIPAQRLSQINDLIKSRGAISVTEIAELLGISESTVRRDLKKLGDFGLVQRSYGGAVAVESTTHEPLFTERRRHNPKEKLAIGRYSLKFIEPGQSVIFDSSSTVLALVEAFRKHPVHITAITNDLNIGSDLSNLQDVKVLIAGGEIRPGSQTLWGYTAQAFLKNIHADIAFMGIHAITENTLSDTSLRIAEMKRAIMNAAKRVILLADHSKFGPPAFIEVGRLNLITDLVTNNGIPQKALDTIKRASKKTYVHVV
jgi:DeoR family transcriptional regulator of aga operon